MNTDSVAELTDLVRQFCVARGWTEYHQPQALVLALVAEVGELAHEFLWLSRDEQEALIGRVSPSSSVGEELADVMWYLLRLADVLGVDLAEALRVKLAKNEGRAFRR